ncbi:metallophosphoesterase [Haloplanus natans]|uniref:metallophosphoesterase n=1 Tax=Haloplanus natans TaxID=376171 RepID=UPI000B049FCE|nr:metallophosphoesterase [Haloplanus natans]
MVVSPDKELIELYDGLSVLYDSLPAHTNPEWKLALESVLYGGELLAEDATCYGKQQNRRNDEYRRDRVKTHGNGTRITEFSAIQVEQPRPQDREYFPSGAMVPIAPKSETVLPAEVNETTVDKAIALLAEFPAEPSAESPGVGVTTLLDPSQVSQVSPGQSRKSKSCGQAKLLFVSDTHLGYENRITTGSGATVSWIRELSSTDTFKQIRTNAIDLGVDAVVHTGDILDHEVDQETLDAIEFELTLLATHNIPVYCIIGSHDHDAYRPQYQDSVNGIAWLKKQIQRGVLTELSTRPSKLGDTGLNLYGISAGNVGIDDVGSYQSRSWEATEVAFTPSQDGLNVLCLHDSFPPYRRSKADIDLDLLLSQSEVSFDCVLIGDEHRPKNGDFSNGYTFQSKNGTPVYYTGPAMRISEPYRNRDAFVTELTMSDRGISSARHFL